MRAHQEGADAGQVESDAVTVKSPTQDDDQFRDAFEGAGTGMALVALGRGLQGRCMTVNSMLAGMLAMPVEELTSIPMTDFIAEADHRAWNDVLGRLEADEQSARLTVRLRARGGRETDALLNLSVALDDTGWWRCAIVQIVPA